MQVYRRTKWKKHILTQVLIIIPFLLAITSAEDDPVVTISEGKLRGRIVEQPGVKPNKYYAFEGIPYAAPPVGERRFKDPVEPEAWNNTLNATSLSPECIHMNFITNEVEGVEDCLYINIYTPKAPWRWTIEKLPVVMVVPPLFLWSIGSLKSLQLNDLLSQDIVVVTFNSRQGVLGFLNTEDPRVPGNAGLKDIQAALRWLQQNAGAVGGDKKRVTLLGDGAGAAQASLLTVAPGGTGLARRGIWMSGSALAPWALTRQRRDAAVTLWEDAKAEGGCMDSATLLSCLRGLDPDALLRAANGRSRVTQLSLHYWDYPFLPSVEAPCSDNTTLLTREPEQLMRTSRYDKYPVIMGFTNAEAIFYLWLTGLTTNASLWSDVDKKFDTIYKSAMPPGLKTTAAVKEMRKFYLGGDSLNDAYKKKEKKEKFVTMLTDLLVAVSTVSNARLMADSGAEVYMYEFAYESKAPLLKRTLYGAETSSGAAHGEDFVYLLGPGTQLNQAPKDAKQEDQMRKRWLKYFADFINEGNPTPGTFSSKWKPYTTKEENYLYVGKGFDMKKQVLKKRMEFWRKLATCEKKGVCESNPVVHTAQGYVRGRQQKSVAGCSYFSWQGLPYAQPPVGPLRFKDAEPPCYRHGVSDALSEGSKCPQSATLNVAGYPNSTTTAGDEDCLHAQVYSPRLPTWLADPLPVMAWVHGGRFVAGSGLQSDAGPDYFVCEGVVMMAFNYRLGPLGFLYLGEAAPGNAGLKDQVRALRWAYENIAAFAGRRDAVTVAGLSAGGASVGYLLLSPLSKGLFQRAIASSGSALDQWAVQTAPIETSLRLAEAVGCRVANTTSDANDTSAVVACLRDTPVDKIIPAALGPARTPVDENRIIPYTFVPTIDLPAPEVEQFLPNSAQRLLEKGEFQAVPLLTGFTTRESIVDLAFADFRNTTIADAIDCRWNEKILPELGLPSDSKKDEALKELRSFYMNGTVLNKNSFLAFLDLLTDVQFGRSVFYLVPRMSKKSPVYLYSFDVDDKFNRLKKALNIKYIPGAEHGSDINYLLPTAELPHVYSWQSAAQARKRMVRLWTNFVKYGKPTIKKDGLLNNVNWKPYTEKQKNYLHIGKKLRTENNFYKSRSEFWKKFNDKYY